MITKPNKTLNQSALWCVQLAQALSETGEHGAETWENRAYLSHVPFALGLRAAVETAPAPAALAIRLPTTQ